LVPGLALVQRACGHFGPISFFGCVPLGLGSIPVFWAKFDVVYACVGTCSPLMGRKSANHEFEEWAAQFIWYEKVQWLLV